MSPKSDFFKSKAHILYLLFIVVGALEFLKCVLVSTLITSSRYDKSKQESGFLPKKNKSQKSVGSDVKEVGSLVGSEVGQKLGQRLVRGWVKCQVID